MDRAMKQSSHQFHKKNVHSLKIFIMQCSKKIRVENNKKRMNIASYINMYTNIYVICGKND